MTPLNFQRASYVVEEECQKRPVLDVWIIRISQAAAGVEHPRLELVQEDETTRAEDLVDGRYELTEVAHTWRCGRGG